MYAEVLTLRLPNNVNTIGYTDGIGITIVAKRLEAWLQNSGLLFDDYKTEVVLMRKRRQETTMKIKIGEQIVYSQPKYKCLGFPVHSLMEYRAQ